MARIATLRKEFLHEGVFSASRPQFLSRNILARNLPRAMDLSGSAQNVEPSTIQCPALIAGRRNGRDHATAADLLWISALLCGVGFVGNASLRIFVAVLSVLLGTPMSFRAIAHSTQRAPARCFCVMIALHCPALSVVGIVGH